MTEIISPKKLIEVAIPLDAINDAAAAEKQPGIGAHPRGLHLWFARRPLAAARAVIYAQLVHDPEDLWRCQNPGREPSSQNRSAWTKARMKHFSILEDLVKWENRNNESVIRPAREAIRTAWRQTCELNETHPRAAELFDPDRMPGLSDPFAGGGAIPLEAQRLGLEARAGDLNPVAVLINKAMIEVPPRFAGMPPVSSSGGNGRLIEADGPAAAGLATDVRYYGEWVRTEAMRRIGHAYPKVDVTEAMAVDRPDLRPYVGQSLEVLTWIWARTVRSPSPAFAAVEVPLVSNFMLATKAGKEAYVEPIVESAGYRFSVRAGKPQDVRAAAGGTTAGKRGAFRCLMSGAPISYDHIRSEGRAGRLGVRLMAIVAEGARGRVYLSPTSVHESASVIGSLPWKPELALPDNPRDFKTPNYGLGTYADLFTDRQLLALTVLADLVGEVRARVLEDAVRAGRPSDSTSLAAGGSGATAYAEAVSLYLAFAVSRIADYNSSIATWKSSGEQVMQTFKRPAVPMTWDFPESNILGTRAICWTKAVKYAADSLEQCGPFDEQRPGLAEQADAHSTAPENPVFVSTDPPYYDNIGYGELSDFFYIWLRRSLGPVFPSLFSTIVVPKDDELIADQYRHGGKADAEAFFLQGMTGALRHLAEGAHPGAPLTIYYAFKQSDTGADGTDSAGWASFLGAVIRAGLAVTGTWPMRTELRNRMIGSGTNALASSIVLACRPRTKDADKISRRQFVRMLNAELPAALDAMTRVDGSDHSPVAPVDLSQAVVGPGMAIFSRYAAVLEADGTEMPVKTALQLINRFLVDADFDNDTQFCLVWFEQHGWGAGAFGEADTLARAKGTSVDGVKGAGVIESGGGSVRLLRWKEYSEQWEADRDSRLPAWEALHRLVRAYEMLGDAGAARVLASLGALEEPARQLAYRLFTVCERKGWSEDARSYNQVVSGWGAIEEEAARIPGPRQDALFGIEEGSA